MDKTIINTFCDIVPEGHSEVTCHVSSQDKRRILNDMKQIVNKLESG